MTTKTADETRWGLAKRREWLSAVCNALDTDGKRAPAAARDVAAQMALSLNSSGQAWVSIDTLADRGGRSTGQTSAGRSWLISNGFLEAIGWVGRSRKVAAHFPDSPGIPERPARDSGGQPPGFRNEAPGIPGTKYLEAPEGVLLEVVEDNGVDEDDPDAVDENGYLLDPGHQHSAHLADYCTGCRELPPEDQDYYDRGLR